MSQMNMLDAIGDKMDQLDFDGDLSLNWDKDAHVIELEITMTAESESGVEVEDQTGTTVDDGPVTYQDAILFMTKRGCTVPTMQMIIWLFLDLTAKRD